MKELTEEKLSWFASAILAHVCVGAGLNSESYRIIEEIQSNEETNKFFLGVMEKLTKANEFGITEMTSFDRDEVVSFVRDAKREAVA